MLLQERSRLSFDSGYFHAARAGKFHRSVVINPGSATMDTWPQADKGLVTASAWRQLRIIGGGGLLVRHRKQPSLREHRGSGMLAGEKVTVTQSRMAFSHTALISALGGYEPRCLREKLRTVSPWAESEIDNYCIWTGNE